MRFQNARARNTHVEATLNHPCPAQVPKTLGGDCPDKKIDALLAELVADGFPRAAKSTTAAAPAASAAAPAAFAYEAPPDAAKAA